MVGLNVKPSELIVDKPADKAKTEKVLPTARTGAAMTDSEFEALVYEWANDARHYVDEQVAQDREHATDYYKGRLPDVDKEGVEEDRSQAVMTEVRDTVLGLMPDLLRIFFAADGVVKFNPVPATDPAVFAKHETQANQATAYVRSVVLNTDNPDFFSTIYDAFQDALVRKTGFLKWWWEKTKRPQYSSHTGLSEEQALALAADDEVTILAQREYDHPADPAALMSGVAPAALMPGAPPPPPVKCFDLKIRRTATRGRLRVRAIPNENVIVARRGSSLDRTPLFGYTEDKSVGDFIAEGWIDSADEIEDCDRDPNDTDNAETEARRPKRASSVGTADSTPQDPSQRIVKYGELYVVADRDGDGIPELIRVITAGTRFKILDEEAVDEIPYAALCPYPEAHQFFGDSVADLTKDIQRIKSRILRDTLDSLAQAVQPQITVVEGQVNLDDVLNSDTSKIMRQRAPGMVQPFNLPFVGKEALPVLDLMTQTRENRTGQSDASAGLDPKVLQSSTQDAVHATLTKAQSRVEMIARVFAETGMTRLFRGILRTTIRNIDEPRVVRLLGSSVSVDPRDWNAEMDVEVTLVLGRGSQQDQLGMLAQILAKQEQVIMQLGFDNPVCNIDQYTYTLGKLVEAGGWRNTASFFSDTSRLDPQAKQEFIQKITQAMAAKAGGGKSGPDPQIEQAKIASNEKIEMMKLQLAHMEIQGKMQLETLKQKAQLEIEALRILSDHSRGNDNAILDAHVAHAGARLDAHVAHQGNVMANATKFAIAQMQPTEEPAANE